MTTGLASTDNSLEADLERAELLQKKDVAGAEEGYRAVLNRKAGESLVMPSLLNIQRMRRSSNAKRQPF